MNNICEYCICDNASIKEALVQINNLSNRQSLVLFVIDSSGKLLGSLTDGDIRRKIIDLVPLDAPVSEAMYKGFHYMHKDCKDVKIIKQYRSKGISLLPVIDSEGKIIDIFDLKQKISILPIDAVLMAGGKGERLRPLTEITPKPLLKVGDKAIIDHNIDRLIIYGVEHISVTVNYLKEQIEEHYRESRNDVKINCCREPKFLGTLGSIKFIEHFYNDSVLVMNSDLFTNINYEDFYLHFIEHDADMSVAAIPYSISVPYGICDLDGCDVKGVIEKPTYNYYANAGIYLLKRNVLDLIPDDTFFNATDMIELLVKAGKKVVRFPLNGTWIDIGNPQEYQKANELVKYIK